MDGLLRVWAITTTSKEVLLINEVEEVLEYIQPAEFERISVKLFTRIAKCMKSAHFQVAERALFIWNNDEIVNWAQHRSARIIHTSYLYIGLVLGCIDADLCK